MAWYNNQSGDTPLEWNSNALVLKRFNEVIDLINNGRANKDVDMMLEGIVRLYKEVHVDLKPEEEKIWDRIKNIIIMNSRPTQDSAMIGTIFHEGRLFAELDEIDITLRKYAKVHGYLTSNKSDPRKAIMRR